jgi:hypothetical protein
MSTLGKQLPRCWSPDTGSSPTTAATSAGPASPQPATTATPLPPASTCCWRGALDLNIIALAGLNRTGPGGSVSRSMSDAALMDITPAVARAMLQRDGDGMVGLLVVCLSVLVGRVVGAGHPAAGQAEPQPHPAASAIKALQTLGRVWLDPAGAREMIARPGVVPRLGWSWHRFPRAAVL